MSTPHLPAEIHAIIASYLALDDLPAYRLSAKQFADIGAQYLFQNLTFHADYASLARLENVAYSRHREFVQTITWNTYLLDPDTCAFNQCFLETAHANHASLLADQHTLLSTLQTNLPTLLTPFLHLSTLLIEKRTPHTSKSSHLSSQYTFLPTFKNPLPLGGGGGGGRAPFSHPTDTLPFLTALQTAQSPLLPTPYALSFQSLNYAVFRPRPYITYLSAIDVSRITHLALHFPLSSPSHNPQDASLRIVNCARVLKAGHLKHLLRKMANLESLELDFETRSTGNGRAGAELADVFELSGRKQEQGREEEGGAWKWEKLRDLKILHVDSDAATMGALLGRHAGTLRRLALGDVCLEPPGSWEALLAEVQPGMELERAEFSYYLFDARIEGFLRGRSALVGWYVDGEETVEMGRSEVGRELGEFMVGGGTCPLWEQRKMTRVVGRLEERRVEDWVRGARSSVV